MATTRSLKIGNKALLTYFKENQFTLLTRDDLEDKDIYASIFQTRRAVIGRLLQKIMKRNGFEYRNFEELFKKYQSIKNAD